LGAAGQTKAHGGHGESEIVRGGGGGARKEAGAARGCSPWAASGGRGQGLEEEGPRAAWTALRHRPGQLSHTGPRKESSGGRAPRRRGSSHGDSGTTVAARKSPPPAGGIRSRGAGGPRSGCGVEVAPPATAPLSHCSRGAATRTAPGHLPRVARPTTTNLRDTSTFSPSRPFLPSSFRRFHAFPASPLHPTPPHPLLGNAAVEVGRAQGVPYFSSISPAQSKRRILVLQIPPRLIIIQRSRRLLPFQRQIPHAESLIR
jgi:hypothetical protein